MSGPGTDAPALVTKTEAARLLGVSRYTIYALVRSGRLREITIGDGMNPRLRRADVVALSEGGSPVERLVTARAAP